MAVFVAASDETSGATHRDPFMRCGFLAPLDDWISLAGQWDVRVLAGPPRIPYLHMTDIRSPKWLTQQSLLETDAERRVDEAFRVIADWPSLTPIGMTVASGSLYDTYTKKVMLTSGGKKKFVPDHLAFTSYAYAAILFCQKQRPDAEKVDFIIEKNGEITDHIKEFYAGMAIACEVNGHPKFVRDSNRAFADDCMPKARSESGRDNSRASPDRNIPRDYDGLVANNDTTIPAPATIRRCGSGLPRSRQR